MAYSLSVQWLTLVALFGQAASFRSHTVQAVNTTLRTTQALEPFDLLLTIKNKEEIMNKKFTSWFGPVANKLLSDEGFTTKVADKLVEMIPEAMRENMNMIVLMEKESVQGLTARIKFTIAEYDLRELLITAKGGEFADAFFNLGEALTGLGMGEKFNEVGAKVETMLRSNMMIKLPQKISEQMAAKDVEVDVSVDPPAPPMPPAPVQEVSPRMDMAFRVRIPDREVMASRVGGLKATALKMMPQKTFIKTVQGKLEERIAAGIKEQMGEALDLKVTTESDNSAGDNSKSDSFFMVVSVNGMDILGMLRKKQGDEFANNFDKLLKSLNTMLAHGAENLRVALANLDGKIKGKVLDNMRTNLVEKLQTNMGAEVVPISMMNFDMLQNTFAPKGRCCGSSKAGPFWVAADLVDDGCPSVSPAGACKVTARRMSSKYPKDTVSAHYRPYTECFDLGTDDTSCELTAPTIGKTC